MKKSFPIMGLLLALAMLVPLAPLCAQTTASIFGTVTDESGAVVRGTKVLAINTLTNESRATASNESGYYAFPELPVGSYRVRVEFQVFGPPSGRASN